MLSLLLALPLVLADTYVSGETCGTRWSTGQCKATQDYIFVVDNSWSVVDDHGTINAILLEFIDEFALVAGDASSPRIGCAPTSLPRAS